MNMKKRVSGLVIKDNALLLIYRLKNGSEYYVFPGGGVEDGETPEEAMYRELEEESSVKALLINPVCIFKNGDRLEYFYTIPHAGEKLELGGPEKDRQSGDNVYRLEWVPFEKIKDLALVPVEMKEWVLKNILK